MIIHLQTVFAKIVFVVVLVILSQQLIEAAPQGLLGRGFGRLLRGGLRRGFGRGFGGGFPGFGGFGGFPGRFGFGR